MNSSIIDGMQKCGDDLLTDFCYIEHDGTGYEVYTDYQSCQDSWLVLPGFNLLPKEFLGAVWFFFLIYLFVGVSIISDVFMSAIEVITAKEKVVKRVDKKTGEVTEIHVQVWNATVANLTLLALGSSAPEILLAVIETLINLGSCDAQDPGEIGTATIVGSASFNLLIITGICMLSVPEGETRDISELPVFLCTAFFSLLAYIWVYIVYEISSPEVVDLWEAIVTFALFPLLIGLSYAADRGIFSGGKKDAEEDGGGDAEKGDAVTAIKGQDGPPHHDTFKIVKTTVSHSQPSGGQTLTADRDTIAKLMKKAHAEGSDVTTAELAQMLPNQEKMSRMRWRINAARMLMGKHYKPLPTVRGFSNSTVAPVSSPSMARAEEQHRERIRGFANSTEPVLGFRCRTYSVLESAGVVKLVVMRGGPLDAACTVEYFTREGSAQAEEDFKPVKGTLAFAAGQDSQVVEVEIVDDNQWEPDETFTVHLEKPSAGVKIIVDYVEVTIVDDDDPGILMFEKPQCEVPETDPAAVVTVVRHKGADGIVSVEYETIQATALEGVDYHRTTGTATFQHGETRCDVRVPLIDDKVPELEKSFKLRLSNPTGGATISRRSECEITIIDDDRVTKAATELASLMEKKKSMLGVETSSWAQQFKDALVPAGAVNEAGEEEELGASDLLMHYLAVTWKVIFAIVPPTDMGGGWYTFCCSLAMIGGVTAIVGEVAALFGCAIGLEDSVTAISFVALGTSLPDTFASRQATVEGDDADAAIGNVTGSNSVNVFLGLGLPWMIATLYYEVGLGCKFEVKSGALSFSVMIFMIFACICLGSLLVRRALGMGELGGNKTGRIVCACIYFSMWFAYILSSSLQAYGHIKWGDAKAPPPPAPLYTLTNSFSVPKP